MTYHESQIIKYVKRVNQDAIVSTDELINAGIALSRDDIRSCAKYMEEHGLIDILSIDLNEDVRLHLSYKGQHPYSIAWIELKGLLFKSVFIPIVVSVITTLIVMWLSSLQLWP